MTGELACDLCFHALPPELLNRGDFAPCPSCGTLFRVEVFPAFSRLLDPGKLGENVLAPGEATCFYHPEKRAAATCERCGVFLCQLCDLAVAGEHVCPKCLEGGIRKKTLRNLENERFRYDRLALSLAVLPLLIFYFTLFTAPAAIWVAIKHWKSPTSIVRPQKWPFVVAILIACVEIAGWVILALFLMNRFAGGAAS